MLLNSTTAQTVDLAALVVALRRWYETTADSRPNELLTGLASIRARAATTPDEQLERGLLLLWVQQRGPLEIPDDPDPAPRGLAQRRDRDLYPRGRSGPHAGPRKHG